MLPAADRQPAHVLHRRPFRETSVIVELLTRDHGLVGGVVRGARGAGRRARPIEPFSEVVVAWRGRGELVNVLRHESVAARRLSGERLFAGLYVNELLVKMLGRGDPVSGLFHRYADAVSALVDGDDMAGVLRSFERTLLDELGYGLAFDIDVRNGQPIDRRRRYDMVVGEGFRECTRNGGEIGGRRDEPLTLSGSEIAAIDVGDYRDRRIRRAAKHVFRSALELRLGGRSLATRRLFGARAGSAGVAESAGVAGSAGS